ncbi:MAG: ABC transporter substrate-binding protein [Firmicutes bacterium]|nr:ABC transporter substrate-binding protein [Bacillota bacterium]
MKKKVLSLLLASAMVVSMAACGGNDDAADNSTPVSQGSDSGDSTGTQTPAPENTETPVVDTYTFHDYMGSMPKNWNDHAWEESGEDTLRSYLSSPFCTMSILDSEEGVYQWVYFMATSIEDVTADHQDDLTKYPVILPDGATPETVTDGYVFEIKLNPDAKWEDGTIINADSYIYSMKQLLNPEMKNYRANLTYAGESAVAGGNAYYNAGSEVWQEAAAVAGAMEGLTVAEDGSYTLADGSPVYISLTDTLSWLSDNTLTDYVDAYGDAYFGVEDFTALQGMADENGHVLLNAESLPLITGVITAVAAWGETDAEVINYLVYLATFPECDYDSTVGCYKVDDYTIRYVCESHIDYNYFLTSCTSTWLVHEGLYEAGKDTTGKLVTTDYCTSKETTMSYGPYRIESMQQDKQIVLVQNENWFGWEKDENGALVSYTNYEVDGERRQQYQTTSIVIDIMEADSAKQAFLKGELSNWTPTPDDLLTYSTSDQLYKVDETYTMSLFFNTGVDNLKVMDESKGNTNSIVLSNINFRKAMSLAIDRAEYVSATAGYKPAYALLNNLYFYDVYNDPTSSYRNSDEAMQAVCNLYGIEYGAGTPYATLRDAYTSVNGYNLTEAKELMATACQELVDAGLYTAGEPIKIRVAWTSGELSSAHQQQIALLNKFINAALEGSGFGSLELEAIGNVKDPNAYDAVPMGEYAIGYGAWGGAAFYPFRNLQVYCDPDQYDINEAGCWDPTKETLTLNVNGEEVTQTWQTWSQCMVGTGRFANEGFDTKLSILAQMEEEYLKKYYRIPLAGSTSCTMLSYQVQYYTENYNIMYGFGGLDLMTYNYTDAEWAEYVASQNGSLNYE